MITVLYTNPHLGHPHRVRLSLKRQEAIAALQLDDDGKPVAHRRPRAAASMKSKRPATAAQVGTLTAAIRSQTVPDDDGDDAEDDDFIPPLVDTDDESDDEDSDRALTNAEVHEYICADAVVSLNRLVCSLRLPFHHSLFWLHP